MLTFASIALLGRGFTRDTASSENPSADTNISTAAHVSAAGQPKGALSNGGIQHSTDNRLVAYYVIEDTCPAAAMAVEIKSRKALRSIRSADAERRATLLSGVNRLLMDSLEKIRRSPTKPRPEGRSHDEAWHRAPSTAGPTRI